MCGVARPTGVNLARRSRCSLGRLFDGHATLRVASQPSGRAAAPPVASFFSQTPAIPERAQSIVNSFGAAFSRCAFPQLSHKFTVVFQLWSELVVPESRAEDAPRENRTE